MTGTENQVAHAEQIRARVDADFNRVAKVLLIASSGQSEQDRANTRAIIALLEEKRTEVMANGAAGYFIQYWHEPGDRVRQMIIQDPRYTAIKAKKTPQ